MTGDPVTADPVTAEPPPRLFVYGTLRPGGRNAALAARFGLPEAQAATLSGFRLLHLSPENYPALVPDGPGERVHGELLTYPSEVWAEALPLLDALEGLGETPPLYHRQRVTVTLGAGEVEAWTYVYARTERLSLPGAAPVPGGDWQHR